MAWQHVFRPIIEGLQSYAGTRGWGINCVTQRDLRATNEHNVCE